MKKIIAFSIATGTLLLGSTQAQANTLSRVSLDSFNQQPQSVTVNVTSASFPVSETDTSDFDASIFGGYRTIFAEVLDAEGPSRLESDVSLSFSGEGTFKVNADSGVDSRTVVTYDGNDSPGMTPSLAFDLTGADANAFGLDIVRIDLNATVEFNVIDNSGNIASLSQSGLEAGEVIFDFEDFGVISGAGTVDDVFSDVASISFEVSGPDALDATFDNLKAVKTGVPESSSVLSLIGLVGLAAGAGIRKKMQ